MLHQALLTECLNELNLFSENKLNIKEINLHGKGQFLPTSLQFCEDSRNHIWVYTHCVPKGFLTCTSRLLKYPSSHLVDGILLADLMTCLIFTCATDEHSATKGHSSPSAGMDSHRQRFNERSLLKCDIIRQPEQFLKRETKENLCVLANRQMRQLRNWWCNLGKTLVLVTEVGTVCVIATEVSIIRGCGTEEDSGRQIIASSLEELVHLTGHTRLNSHSVT